MLRGCSDRRSSPGVKVSPKGFTMSTSAGPAGIGVGGAIGGAISATGGAIAGRKQEQKAAETPNFGRAAYVAVTEDELALIKLKSGLVTFKLDEVIERVPRSEVASAKIGEGIAPWLTITFGNGGTWKLEFGRVVKKDAKAVVRALGGELS
jgi:hypothetical protein